MADRYTKVVLTIIAGALVYLCVVMTAFPAVQAQTTQRPGEFTGRPVETIVVGWKTDALPIVARQPLQVQTERSTGRADRMVIVGWEEGAAVGQMGSLTPIVTSRGSGLPVSPLPK